MKGIELVKQMQKAGWKIDRINGSHYIMKKDGQIEVVPVHSKDMNENLLKSIKKRRGLK